jgi:murein DD-endopeptidase MepM/ murein hydrolase activator NlpD
MYDFRELAANVTEVRTRLEHLLSEDDASQAIELIHHISELFRQSNVLVSAVAEQVSINTKLVAVDVSAKEYLITIANDFRWIAENISDVTKFIDANELADDHLISEGTILSLVESSTGLIDTFTEILFGAIEGDYQTDDFSTWDELDEKFGNILTDESKELAAFIEKAPESISPSELSLITAAIARKTFDLLLMNVDQAASSVVAEYSRQVQSLANDGLLGFSGPHLHELTAQIDEALEAIMNGGTLALSAASQLVEETHRYYVKRLSYEKPIPSWKERSEQYLESSLQIEVAAANKSCEALVHRIASEVSLILDGPH